MYEQGVDPALAGTPLGHGVSAGVHESQSRLWENIVARSRGFWAYFYPSLQRRVRRSALRTCRSATFHRAINKVARSLIRTDADEVTYNLHIMLRFDLELKMLEGKLAVEGPARGVARGHAAPISASTPPDDRDGCLQDVHWYSGGIGGAFQSYTIGNILAAQFLRRGAAGPSGNSSRNRARRIRHAPRLAARQHLSARREISAERARQARHRRADDACGPISAISASKYGALYRLPSVALDRSHAVPA